MIDPNALSNVIAAAVSQAVAQALAGPLAAQTQSVAEATTTKGSKAKAPKATKAKAKAGSKIRTKFKTGNFLGLKDRVWLSFSDKPEASERATLKANRFFIKPDPQTGDLWWHQQNSPEFVAVAEAIHTAHS